MVYPWHLIDHEAAAWIREISGTLSNPNQTYEDSENTGCQQRDSHASSPADGNLTAQGRASSRVGLPSTADEPWRLSGHPVRSAA